MKTILFPTDFSPCSQKAAEYAIGFAKQTGATIIVLNACHVPAFATEVPLDQVSEAQVYNNASSELDLFISNNFKGEDVRIEKYVQFGLAADSISEVAEEKKADIVIMGTRGASGIKEILMGSITSAVTGKVHCAVLAVPQDASYNPFGKIVYATDYREKNFDAIQSLSDIASLSNAEIMVIHVSDTIHTDDYERELFRLHKQDILQKIKYLNLSFHFLTGSDVEDRLNSFIEDNACDLLALATRKRNILDHFVERGLSRKMACHAHLPILVFHLH